MSARARVARHPSGACTGGAGGRGGIAGERDVRSCTGAKRTHLILILGQCGVARPVTAAGVERRRVGAPSAVEPRVEERVVLGPLRVQHSGHSRHHPP